MRFLRIAAVCACALLVSTDLHAQQQIIINGPDLPVPLPGMGPRQPKTGTGRLRGRVLSAETGGPVRRAQIRISGPDIGSKSAMTDAEGRYEFRDLPAGRFSMTATKAGYVTIQYGQTRPFETGRPIDLTEGQLMDKADFSMPRGSAISGRLVDEFGDPIADALVSAMRSAWAGGRRRLQPTGRTSQTNDLGQFRIYGLSPGDYYVSATSRGGDIMAMEMNMSALTGTGASGGPTGSTPNSGYAATYFPGTPNGAEAQKITLGVGQEAQNTDFALLPVKLAKIAGTVISSEGKPVEGSMINAAPRSSEGAGMMMMSGSARTDKNGNFTMTNVSPGEYTLQTRAVQIMTSGGGDNMVFTARVGVGMDGGESETGSLPVTVNGEDLSNVVIVTSKGATATGHLTFEGGAKPTTLTTGTFTAQLFTPLVSFRVADTWRVKGYGTDLIDLVSKDVPDGELVFVQVQKVFQPSSTFSTYSEAQGAGPPQVQPVPADLVSWIQSHPRLSVTSNGTVAEGQLAASFVEFSVKPGSGYAYQNCPPSCVLLFQLQHVNDFAVSGYRERLLTAQVRGRTVAIHLTAPAGQFPQLAARAERLLSSLRLP